MSPVRNVRRTFANGLELAAADEFPRRGIADGERKARSGAALLCPPRDDCLGVPHGRNEIIGEVEPAPVLRIVVCVAQHRSVSGHEEIQDQTVVALVWHSSLHDGGADLALVP